MKKIITFALILSFVFLLVGCSSNTKTFNISNSNKLTIVSGSTGESITITNEDVIKHITENINALNFSKGSKVDSDGWSYALNWMNENGEVIEKITLLGDGYTIIYNGYYYRGMSIDYMIDLGFVEKLFDNQKV